MEVLTKKRLILVAGRGHTELSDEVAAHLKVPLGECVLSTFANGDSGPVGHTPAGSSSLPHLLINLLLLCGGSPYTNG